jgi:hypothetical protein
MQAELEKWVEDNSELGADGKSWVIPDKAVRALLAGKILCDAEPVACRTCKGQGTVIGTGLQNYPTLVCRNCKGRKVFYPPASPLGNADIGKEGGE